MVRAANFTRDAETAAKFGVHEIRLDAGQVPPEFNALDADVRVTFTPAAGKAVTVHAFYDGGATWAARVYVNVTGEWHWTAHAPPELKLARTSGTFAARDSALRGRLLRHTANPSQWMTENGRWFLNVSDTAYFLFAPRDTRGDPITVDAFRAYVRDAYAQGITSLRAFTVWGEPAAWSDDQVWSDAFFERTPEHQLRVANFARTDQRIEWLLNEFPDLYLQLIMMPRGSKWGADETHWHTFPAATKTRVLRYLVARYAAFPQVFWLAVNDAHYGEKFPHNEALAREVGTFLHQNDPWQHPYSTGPARGIEVAFAREPWMTYVHLERRWDLGATAIEPYRATGKPVFLGEDYYEQDRVTNNPEHMDYFQRRLFWSWLLSGGSANYGGRWSSLHAYRSTEGRAFSPYPRYETNYTSGLHGLDSLPHLRRFFADRQIELGEFVPDNGLVSVAGGHTPAGAPKLMRRERRAFVIYHPNSAQDGKAAAPRNDAAAQVTLDLRDVNARFAVEWFDPATGRTFPGQEVRGGASIELAAPWTGGDAVVWLAALSPAR
jgi:hypothetical protein